MRRNEVRVVVTPAVGDGGRYGKGGLTEKEELFFVANSLNKRRQNTKQVGGG